MAALRGDSLANLWQRWSNGGRPGTVSRVPWRLARRSILHHILMTTWLQNVAMLDRSKPFLAMSFVRLSPPSQAAVLDQLLCIQSIEARATIFMHLIKRIAQRRHAPVVWECLVGIVIPFWDSCILCVALTDCDMAKGR